VAGELAEFVRRQECLSKGPKSEQTESANPREHVDDGGAEAFDHDPTVLQRLGQPTV
jgi:hypothetical protein